MSPGTSSAAGISSRVPSRTTRATGMSMSERASTEALAFQLLTGAEHDVEHDQQPHHDADGGLRDEEADHRHRDEHDVIGFTS